MNLNFRENFSETEVLLDRNICQALETPAYKRFALHSNPHLPWRGWWGGGGEITIIIITQTARLILRKRVISLAVCVTVYFWLIRSLVDPTSTDSIIVRGPLQFSRLLYFLGP